MNCTLSVGCDQLLGCSSDNAGGCHLERRCHDRALFLCHFSILSTCFKPGESVLVLGAGFMSMLHVMLAKSWGAGHSIHREKYAEVLIAIEDFLGEIKY